MNRRQLARVSVITLIVVLGSSLHGATEQSLAQEEQVYLALGDSIAAGLSSSLPSERGYPAILRELMQAERIASDAPGAVELINLAEPGETAQSFIDNGQVDAAIERIETEDNLSTVTLTLGGNNMLSVRDASDDDRQTALDEFSQAYQQVIDELDSAIGGENVDVVVTTYYDLAGGNPDIEGSDAWWIAQFNQVIQQTASDAGFQVVDLAGLFDGRISELTWYPADVHPNNAGHELIARAIWQQIGYDEDAPEVSITRPDEDETASRVPTIHAEINDEVGVESVDVYVGDDRVGDLLYVSDRDTWIGIWDAREFDGRNVEVTVVATDLAGNERSDSVPVSLPARQGIE